MGWNTGDDGDEETSSNSTVLDFDMDEVQPEKPRDFSTMKRGFYPCLVTGSQQSSNAAGWRGQQIEVTVVAGEHKGRKVWGMFTTHHKTSTKAMQIGRGQLKAMFLATGVGGSDIAAVVASQVPLMVSIGIEAPKGAFNEKNTIDGFREMTSDELAAVNDPEPKAMSAPAAAAPASASTKPKFTLGKKST